MYVSERWQEIDKDHEVPSINSPFAWLYKYLIKGTVK
jgi:hypothetical protein